MIVSFFQRPMTVFRLQKVDSSLLVGLRIKSILVSCVGDLILVSQPLHGLRLSSPSSVIKFFHLSFFVNLVIEVNLA